jgi:hypothetical protein
MMPSTPARPVVLVRWIDRAPVAHCFQKCDHQVFKACWKQGECLLEDLSFNHSTVLGHGSIDEVLR